MPDDETKVQPNHEHSSEPFVNKIQAAVSVDGFDVVNFCICNLEFYRVA
jgi:hypothetical protein